MINFGEWLPDQPDLNLNGVTVATNVIPAAAGYRSIPSFVQVSNAADSALLGLFAAKDNSANVTLFAGDAAKLYKFDVSNRLFAQVGSQNIASKSFQVRSSPQPRLLHRPPQQRHPTSQAAPQLHRRH